MPTLIAGIVAVALLYVALNVIKGADPKWLAKIVRTGGGIVTLAAALFVGARGEFAVAIPLGVFGAGLLGWSPFGAQLGSAWGNYGPGAWKSHGQKSKVRSQFIEMTLDHDTGTLSGVLTAGPEAGRVLDDFTLDELIDDMLRTLHPRLKHLPHRIETDIPAGLHFDSYPGPLGQVVQNLIDNALAHAFHEHPHGMIRLRARSGADDAAEVRIEVEDDGSGIPPEHLPRIFDPFFTTRRGRGGTGLGLHLSHQFAHGLLGGRLQVASRVGIGTCFTLIVPRIAPAAPDAAPAAAPPA